MLAPSNPSPVAPFRWQQGEHIAVVGDTGTGKTFLLTKLIPMRQYVVVFRTKLADRKEPKFTGFAHGKTAKDMDGYAERIIITPEYNKQGEVGWEVFEKVWKQGSWTVVVDELYYVERLGLRSQIEKLLTQGRSQDITVVTGMQRPVWVSRFALSQITHLFTFRTENRDAKVLGEAFTDRIKGLIHSDSPDAVQGHNFAYFNRATRQLAIGNANKISSLIRL